MQLSNNVLAVLALAMTATALPAKDATLIAKDTALAKREFCYGLPPCCLAVDLYHILSCIYEPPANCGAVANARFCCDEVGAVNA